ncbi:hypothetical protein SPRG_10703, partial [Saprolegnia parasitica CBS 223.65]
MSVLAFLLMPQPPTPATSTAKPTKTKGWPWRRLHRRVSNVGEASQVPCAAGHKPAPPTASRHITIAYKKHDLSKRRERSSLIGGHYVPWTPAERAYWKFERQWFMACSPIEEESPAVCDACQSRAFELSTNKIWISKTLPSVRRAPVNARRH